MADNRKYIGGKTYRLKSTITSSDTSIVLSSFTNIGDDAEITTADIGGKAYATIEPGGSKQEFISFTGVTQDGSNAEATLTGVTRGLDPNASYAGSATFAKSHAGGSVLVISNSPAFYDDFANKENEETISQEWTFGANPKTSAGDPTNDDHFARKSYVDGASGGSTSKDRTVIAATAGETIAAGDVVYFDTSDQEWKKADADATATAEDVEIGIAQGAGTDGAAITNGVLIAGLDSNQTGMTPGAAQYVSATAGALTESAPTIKTQVGIAIDATNILVERHSSSTPTGREKDALEGFGTPSSTNKYITQDASDVQVYTDPTANPATWTKPSAAKTVRIIAIGGGGGGASGARDSNGSNQKNGGAGGGGGHYSESVYQASDLGATLDVYVGAGGTGGAGVSSNGGGNDGTAGGDSYVEDSGTQLATAYGGDLGESPDTTTGSADGGDGGGFSVSSGAGVGHQGALGDGGTADNAEYGGGSGGGGQTSSAVNYFGGSSLYGAGGGGGGAGIISTAREGGAGGTGAIMGGAAAGGARSTGAGANGANATGVFGGAGGSGGGGNGNNGGDGGNYGGGGGGGAAGSGTSGAGGDGADGAVMIITYT